MSAHGRFTARPEARYCAALAPVLVQQLCANLKGTALEDGDGLSVHYRFATFLYIRPQCFELRFITTPGID